MFSLNILHSSISSLYVLKINSRLSCHIIFPCKFTKSIMFLERIKIFSVLWIMKRTSYRTSVHLNCSNHIYSWNCSNHIYSCVVMVLFQAQQMTSAVFIIHLSSLINCAFAFHLSLSLDFIFFNMAHIQ